MALINCPECGTQVSDMAEKCSKCSYPINSITKPDGAVKSQEGCFLQTLNTGCLILAIIIGIIFLIGIIGAF